MLLDVPDTREDPSTAGHTRGINYLPLKGGLVASAISARNTAENALGKVAHKGYSRQLPKSFLATAPPSSP